MRFASLFATLATFGAASAVTLSAAPALAQEVLLNQYEQPVAGDAFFSVFGPQVGGHLLPRALMTLDYGHKPFVLRNEADKVPVGQTTEVAAPSKGQLFLHVGGSLALWDRLLVSVGMPFALYQSGDTVVSNDATLRANSGGDVGELNIGLRGRILGEYSDPFQLSVGGRLYLPTATKAWGGEGYVYSEPRLLLGGRQPSFVYAAHAGVKLRQQGDPASLAYGVAVAGLMLDGALLIGPEILGETPFKTVDLAAGDFTVNTGTHAELLGGVQYRFVEDFVVGAAAGPGLTTSVGTPVFRGLLRLGYDPPPAEPVVDRDGDGIADGIDACPDTPGVASDDPDKHGCPADTDGDGILDEDDACVDVPGVANADATKNGCPPDTDGDGILDRDDACVDVPGVANADPTKNGCPADTDGDGILDKDDACVNVPGSANADPAKNGCPDTDGDGIVDGKDACPDNPGAANADPTKHGCPKVVMTEKEIVILERIEFETGKAVIRPVSDDIVNQVAKVMKDYPDILSLEVQGHTDNVGSPIHNKILSNGRAKAVKAALIARGIESSRLVAKGFGQDKPIASNTSDVGRQKNRRVQFIILKRTKK